MRLIKKCKIRFLLVYEEERYKLIIGEQGKILSEEKEMGGPSCKVKLFWPYAIILLKANGRVAETTETVELMIMLKLLKRWWTTFNWNKL